MRFNPSNTVSLSATLAAALGTDNPDLTGPTIGSISATVASALASSMPPAAGPASEEAGRPAQLGLSAGLTLNSLVRRSRPESLRHSTSSGWLPRVSEAAEEEGAGSDDQERAAGQGGSQRRGFAAGGLAGRMGASWADMWQRSDSRGSSRSRGSSSSGVGSAGGSSSGSSGDTGSARPAALGGITSSKRPSQRASRRSSQPDAAAPAQGPTQADSITLGPSSITLASLDDSRSASRQQLQEQLALLQASQAGSADVARYQAGSIGSSVTSSRAGSRGPSAGGAAGQAASAAAAVAALLEAGDCPETWHAWLLPNPDSRFSSAFLCYPCVTEKHVGMCQNDALGV